MFLPLGVIARHVIVAFSSLGPADEILAGQNCSLYTQTGMRGPRKFCQMGTNFDKFFFS